jgi:hypothetical protein
MAYKVATRYKRLKRSGSLSLINQSQGLFPFFDVPLHFTYTYSQSYKSLCIDCTTDWTIEDSGFDSWQSQQTFFFGTIHTGCDVNTEWDSLLC